MQKQVVAIGNSLGVIIDKPLRFQLGIKRTTLVRLSTDGKRLIIEPCGDKSEESVQRTEQAFLASAVGQQHQARAIAEDLLHRWSVPNQDFAMLTAGFPTTRLRILHYSIWLENAKWDRLTEAEHRLIRRMEVFYWELRDDKKTRAECIAAALSAYPFDPTDPKERAVGLRD